MRNHEVYKIGDIVTYNGDLSHAFDAITLRLMQANLRTGLEYKIKWVAKYDSQDKDSFCYELEYIVGEKAGTSDFTWYPYQSFFVDYSLKYNLK